MLAHFKIKITQTTHGSVTRFVELHNLSKLLKVFGQYEAINRSWQGVKTQFYYIEYFHCYRWPNIEQIMPQRQ